MPGLFDKIKSGAESARFEAERMVRLQQAQSALSKLQKELETQMAALGQQVVGLYDGGALVQPELAGPCADLATLRQQIADQQVQVEHIKQEKAPAPGEPMPAAAAPTPAATRAPAGTRTCPQCQAVVGMDTRFCPNCGASLAPVAPPPPATVTCPTCGHVSEADVAFCPECGTRLRASGPAA